MNSSQHFRVRMRCDIYKSMKKLTDSLDVDWGVLTEKDVLDFVMRDTRGHYNPKMIEDIIKNL